MPSETLLRKRRPFTSPTSIRPSMPSLRASSAAIGSAGSSPRSRAKWLRVPAGTQTNGRSCASAAAATVASDPSPPATAKRVRAAGNCLVDAAPRGSDPEPNSTTLIPRSLGLLGDPRPGATAGPRIDEQHGSARRIDRLPADPPRGRHARPGAPAPPAHRPPGMAPSRRCASSAMPSSTWTS